jgi:hypothetical protein
MQVSLNMKPMDRILFMQLTIFVSALLVKWKDIQDFNDHSDHAV